MFPLLVPLIGGLIGGGLNAAGYVIQQKLRGEPIDAKVALTAFGSGFVAGALCSMPFGEAVIAAGGVGAWSFLAGTMAVASVPPRIVENLLSKKHWTDGVASLALMSALFAPVMATALMPVVAKIPGLQAAAQKVAADAVDKAGDAVGLSTLESLAPVAEDAETKTAAELWSETTSRAVETWGGSVPMITSVGREVLAKGTDSLSSLLHQTTDTSQPTKTPGVLQALDSVSMVSTSD